MVWLLFLLLALALGRSLAAGRLDRAGAGARSELGVEAEGSRRVPAGVCGRTFWSRGMRRVANKPALPSAKSASDAASVMRPTMARRAGRNPRSLGDTWLRRRDSDSVQGQVLHPR